MYKRKIVTWKINEYIRVGRQLHFEYNPLQVAAKSIDGL